MHVRPYRESDLAALRLIHATQNFPYAFPDLGDPLFLTKIVLTDRDTALAGNSSGSEPTGEKIVGAALLRLTAEAYLLLNPRHGTPRDRWQAVLALQAAAQSDAQQRGLEDVHAWLPPAIANTFGRRLGKLGWRRDDEWIPFCKRFYE
jgi:hypothetical protein